MAVGEWNNDPDADHIAVNVIARRRVYHTDGIAGRIAHDDTPADVRAQLRRVVIHVDPVLQDLVAIRVAARLPHLTRIWQSGIQTMPYRRDKNPTLRKRAPSDAGFDQSPRGTFSLPPDHHRELD